MSETPRDEPIMFLITEAELRNNSEMELFQLIAKRLREAQDAIAKRDADTNRLREAAYGLVTRAARDLHEAMTQDAIAKRDAEKPQ